MAHSDSSSYRQRHRNYAICNRFEVLSILSTNAKAFGSNANWVIGAIADDRMNDAVREFSDYALTDKGLAACLTVIDYEYQRDGFCLNEIVEKEKESEYPMEKGEQDDVIRC